MDSVGWGLHDIKEDDEEEYSEVPPACYDGDCVEGGEAEDYVFIRSSDEQKCMSLKNEKEEADRVMMFDADEIYDNLDNAEADEQADVDNFWA
jgi:hypothetical protein